MNYYKFNVGDYSAATRHLTMLEHGAYRLLLDVYYTTEKPLPADLKAAARKAGARSKDEIAAVETVLGEFFQLTKDGWVNNRCATEIDSYKAKSETNRVVGKMGGRPKKITKTVSENNQDGFQNETQTVSENNPNHKPLTNNQEYPLTPKGADALFDTFWTAYPLKVGKDAARKAFAKRKPTDETIGEMLNAIAEQKTSLAWIKDDGQFIPHPATWLNQGRWMDEVTGLIGAAPVQSTRLAGAI